MKKTVVLYPGLAVGHFNPMMVLADVFLDHGYAVAVALINPSVKDDDAAFTAAVARAVSSKSSATVSFHMLPRIPDPPSLAFDDDKFFTNYFDLVRRYDEHLHDFLFSVQGLHAVVVDASCGFAIQAVRKLGVPAYELYPCDAGALAVNIQIPSLLAGFKKLGGGEEGSAPLELLGVPPMSASHVTDLLGRSLSELISKDPEATTVAAGARVMAEFDGILINTFVSLEERPLRALADPRCCPDGVVLPPVYAVGPLVDKAAAGAGDETSRRHESLVWLDGQPDRSIVFLCFGSIGGNHAEQQLREIAAGLDKSGHRFLWVVRRAPSTEHLDALLPEGFLARTSGRGLVVNTWVPQPSVLRHRATAAFVTHCGWNSVLEGITAGVPMLCWPMYAEQRINKVLMVDDMGVGVEMEGWLEGWVTAEEVEAKVRLVVESEHGRKLRERVEAHRDGAAMAWKDGGSSRVAFARLMTELDNAQR
ncbi:hypothetical protein OsI_31816 [Oryza sativa Indica Group]|uniref:Glycosyltransferase n=1 Tax=Oryza sativa subsp. indica TaxID=39946 RepID=A2Z2H8_ORYSI|nr:hypothetical protein OsI_31816 [Oryza sativa Indica Group]